MADRPPGVRVTEVPSGVRLISGTAPSIAAFIGHIDAAAPRKIWSWKEFDEGAGGSGSGAVSPYLADAVCGWFENGGGPCWIAGTGQGGPLAGYQAALAALDSTLTIVVTPDLWEAQDDGAVIAKTVARHCADARNRMALLHTAQEAEPTEVPALLGLDEEEAQFTTVYYPWLNVHGVDGGGEMAVPPSGHVAGVWARTDTGRGVHKAPANTAVLQATGLQRNLTDDEQADLNSVGVNCLRSFPGQGLLVWGARTLAVGGDWTYLHIRRLANYLQSSIADSLRWVVFEPNDDNLRAAVHASVTTFLTRQWQAGALQGKSAAEAFYVVCDETNNTSDDIAAGVFVVDVGFAAIRPAEFIFMRITQQLAEA
ncbi:phage tail sheath subtilisin-like domain-containing protein [Streptomyces mirabilis]|nr:phage tail sheath subtilisin-like domain-containing protein [Streptomyces mirabilis]